MELYEAILLPIYIFLFALIGLMIREKRYKDATCRHFFIPALLAYFAGALAFDAVYVFYYGGGDTVTYHNGATVIRETLTENFSLGWQLMTLQAGERTLQTTNIIDQIGGYYEAGNTLLVLRIAAIVQLFCFGSFWLTSLFFAAFAFSGMWALYRVMIALYPTLEKQLAMANLFVPSVIFWGSGIMKDTLSMAFLGWLVYGVYHLLVKRDQIIFPILTIPVCAKLIASLKAYIILGFMPALLYWLVSLFFASIEEKKLKSATQLCCITVLGTIAYFKRDTLWSLGDMAVQQFIQLAISFQSWHGFLTEVLERSSGYSLGEIEFTFWGILKKFPAAVNTTLFRPYFTDVNSPVMLLSALESTFLLVGTIYVLVRVGIIRTLGIIVHNPFAMFCLVYSLLFAFAVGFASYNFGALVRYKIPCLPFYTALLFIVPYHHKQMLTKQS